MKTLSDRYQPVQAYYHRHACHDDDARKVAWCTRFDQEFRLHVLLDMIQLETLGDARTRQDPDRRLTLLDVGCGLGAAADLIQRRLPQVDYLGIDILPDMVKGARQRHPGSRFEVADLLQALPAPGLFDVVLCSGTLTVNLGQDHAGWVRRMIAAMYQGCRTVLAFNMQSNRGLSPRQLRASDLYHADPMEWYGRCRKLCPRTQLREDFLDADFAIAMFKGPPPSIHAYGEQVTAHPVHPKDGDGCQAAERDVDVDLGQDLARDKALALAQLYQSHGFHRDALAALQDAPPSGDILNLSASCCLHLGDLIRARDLLQEALRIQPHNVDVLFNLGVSEEKLGHVEGAARRYRDVLQQDPDHDQAGRRLKRLS